MGISSSIPSGPAEAWLLKGVQLASDIYEFKKDETIDVIFKVTSDQILLESKSAEKLQHTVALSKNKEVIDKIKQPKQPEIYGAFGKNQFAHVAVKADSSIMDMFGGEVPKTGADFGKWLVESAEQKTGQDGGQPAEQKHVRILDVNTYSFNATLTEAAHGFQKDEKVAVSVCVEAKKLALWRGQFSAKWSTTDIVTDMKRLDKGKKVVLPLDKRKKVMPKLKPVLVEGGLRIHLYIFEKEDIVIQSITCPEPDLVEMFGGDKLLELADDS